MDIVSKTPRARRVLLAAAATILAGAASGAHANVPGFNNGTGWTSNHSGGYTPQFTASTLQLTNTGVEDQAGSAFFNTPQAVGSGFSAQFVYQQTATADPSAPGDGIAFVLQNTAANALGSQGGSVGYEGINNSLAVVLDLNQGFPRIETTGLGTNGSYADGNGFATAPIVLSSGHQIQVNLTYIAGTDTLTESLKDLTTNGTFTHDYVGVGLPALLGGNNAFVGFTGATGQNDDTQVISGLTVTAADAPEPSVMGLAAVGLTLLGAQRSKRRRPLA